MLLMTGSFALLQFSCAKKKEDTGECKVCKALAAGPDQGTVQKEVCSDSEEQAFRTQYAGREITCQ